MKKIEVTEPIFLQLRKIFAGDIFTQKKDGKFFVRAGTQHTQKELNKLLSS